MKQGEVYLVNFGKKYNSEFGKIRPAVVMQNNFLNHAIDDSIYKSVLVVPLSPSSEEDDYRLAIQARDNLKEDSVCVSNWICTLDVNRFLFDEGLLTVLSEEEFTMLQKKVCSLI